MSSPADHSRTVRLTVPPDRTPEEEARLVAQVAAAYAEQDEETLTIEMETAEEVSYRAMGHRAAAADRWNR